MQKKLHLFMLILLLFLSAIVLYCGNQKEGYYIDELWSYGLSNSYYEPFLQDKGDYLNNWHQPEFYMRYLTVSRGESFSYGSVYYNQAQDVHPPLYYMVLHTLCSFFPERFSKWFGLMVNLIFFCGSVLLLYEISGKLLGEETGTRLIPPFVYGISGGALSTAMYIRMYMLLTFWCLLFTLLIFLFMEKDKNNPALLFLISATTTAGFLTQYYFLIFAFFISAACLFCLFFHRQWKKAVKYSAAVLLGILAGIFLFPPSISHIFLGQKGRDSFANALSFHSFGSRLRAYAVIILKEFGSLQTGVVLLLCMLFAGLFCLLKKKKAKTRTCGRLQEKEIYVEKTKLVKDKWWTLFVSVLGYFCVVAQIATDVVDRYQFAIYPAGVLLVVTAVVFFFRYMGKESFAWFLPLCYLLLGICAGGTGTIGYMEKGYHEALLTLRTKYKDTPGIYVTNGDHLVINDCLFLAQQTMTLPITENQLEELPGLCNGKIQDKLILYVNIYYDEPQTAQTAARLLNFKSVSLLYDNTYTQIYVLSS